MLCSAERPVPSAQLLLTWQPRLMISGLRHDDKWRMVEDEFVAVAHKFTAHLHAAEYRRLKVRARQQNSDAIRSISRPTSALMTDSVKRRQVSLSLKRSQSRGIKRALSRASEADEADADDMPWAGTNLQDLMNSPRKKPVPLSRLVTAVSGTRAAALHRQQSSISTTHSSLPDTTADRRGARGHQAKSPLTDRTAFVRARDQIDRRGDALGRPSASARLSQHISSASPSATANLKPSSTATDQALAPGKDMPVCVLASPTQKSISRPVMSNADDDSDSPVETFFDRRMRERRAERKMAKRKQSVPTGTANEESQPHPKSQRSQVTNVLSVPSL